MKSRLQADSKPAFTMIELLIAIIIIAVLSVAIAVNLGRGVLKARFDDQLIEIVHIIEQARSYSLNNYLIGDTDPAEYYSLAIDSSGLTLTAHGASSSISLEEVELEDGFTITVIVDNTIYYVPPYGSIYIGSETSGTTELLFMVGDDSGTYSALITLNIYGGYPEVENL